MVNAEALGFLKDAGQNAIKKVELLNRCSSVQMVLKCKPLSISRLIVVAAEANWLCIRLLKPRVSRET